MGVFNPSVGAMFLYLIQSLGLPVDLAAPLDSCALIWRRPWTLAVGAPLLVLAAIWIHRRQKSSLPGASRRTLIVLTTLRTATLAVLLLVLAGPALIFDETIVRKPILAVLVDRSQSMELPANYESEPDLASLAAAFKIEGAHGDFLSADARYRLRTTPRIQLLYRLLLSPGEEFWTSLVEKYDVRFYEFADGVERVQVDFASPENDADPSSSSEPLGDHATLIDAALARVTEEAAGESIAGVVLLSDGQEAGVVDASRGATSTSVYPAPIFATPIGSSIRFRDVSIVSLFAPGRVSPGDRVAVNAVLESQGFAGRLARVELWDGEERLDVEEVVLRDGEQQPCELHFTAKAPGVRRLTVKASSQPEEPKFLQANNVDVGCVEATDDKLRVLLIDGLPRWDYRFLKNAMNRDHGLTGVRSAQPDRVLEAEVKHLSPEARLAALPRDAATLAKYHTIILGDASRELLDDAFCRALKTAVTEHGVGLLVAAGPRAVPQTLPESVRSLLPVKVGPGAGRSAPTFAPFRLAITPAGAIADPLRWSLDADENVAVWNDLPPFYWCADVERPSAAATILAVNSALEGTYGPVPLIAWQPAGRGKVMFLGSDSTWLWRRNVGDRYFYKFWGQALRFVARPFDRAAGRSSLTIDPAVVSPERPALVDLRAFDAQGAPSSAKRVVIQVTTTPARDPDSAGREERTTLEAIADPATPGRFIAMFTPKTPGEVSFRFDAGGETAVESRLWVVDRAEELRRPNVNVAALERLTARSAGGSLVSPAAFDELPKRLQGEPRTMLRRRESSLWDNWLVLIVLVGVYCVDVAIRRASGWN